MRNAGDLWPVYPRRLHLTRKCMENATGVPADVTPDTEMPVNRGRCASQTSYLARKHNKSCQVYPHKYLPSVVVKKSRHPFRDRCLPYFANNTPNDVAKLIIIFRMYQHNIRKGNTSAQEYITLKLYFISSHKVVMWTKIPHYKKIPHCIGCRFMAVCLR